MKAAEIVKLCTDAGEDALAADFIRRRAAQEDIEARLERAREIRQAVAAAVRVIPTLDGKAIGDKLVHSDIPVARAREELLGMVAEAQSPEIASRHSTPSGGSSGTIPQGNHGWDTIMAREAKRMNLPVAQTFGSGRRFRRVASARG